MRFPSAFMAVAVLVASMVIADDTLDESRAIEKIELLGGKVTRARFVGRVGRSSDDGFHSRGE